MDYYPKKIDTNNISEIIEATKGSSTTNIAGRITFYGFVVINTKDDEEQVKSLFENNLDYFKYASKTISYSVAIVDRQSGTDPDYDDLIKNYLNSDLNDIPGSCLVAGIYKTGVQTINKVDSLSKSYIKNCN